MILVVGGNARGVGKTTLVCHLIRLLPEWPWTAVKVSGHPHGSPPSPTPRPTPRASQPRATERFLQAGAAAAHLLRDTAADRALLEDLAGSDRPLVIESNRAVEWVRFDAYLFVLDPGAADPKPPERCFLARATWVLPPRTDPPEVLVAAMRRLLVGRG